MNPDVDLPFPPRLVPSVQQYLRVLHDPRRPERHPVQPRLLERPPPDDDDSSIVMEPPRNVICGACRTRESEVWWKAPKGLPSGVLCDNCGLSWRKYADLNVRPIREETVTKAKVGEKREGTPLNGNQAKRAKTASSQSTPPRRASPRLDAPSHSSTHLEAPRRVTHTTRPRTVTRLDAPPHSSSRPDRSLHVSQTRLDAPRQPRRPSLRRSHPLHLAL
ncbi:hypothetical protein NUW54_g8472 [Trametes sanguinea]|uniref:Uncharacterized protein n=1 Tax=Trametes sanguinea TaxID=158606 RepID=A0ACC1PE51_9APHY|nr:hypothetical protein NUW54_g8472 [Trametes sanguinea]